MSLVNLTFLRNSGLFGAQCKTSARRSSPKGVIGVAVAQGAQVTKGQKLLSLEAMKMETVINAERDGEIAQLLVNSGSQVEAGDLLLVLK